MSFDLGETIDLLQRTPAVLDALLRGISPSWHQADEGPETWSAFEVVGHLIHAEETDWLPRARTILEFGATRPFDPFDRFGQQRLYADWTLEALLDRFAEKRRESLEVLRGWRLSEKQLALPGFHPALGAVELRHLLATWAAHDLNHLGQISRVMAKRYSAAVGPWREYLSILTR